MIDRTYKCNFCREAIKDATEGFAIRWKGSSLEDCGVYLSGAENHICNTCIKAIKNFTPAYVIQDSKPRSDIKDVKMWFPD